MLRSVRRGWPIRWIAAAKGATAGQPAGRVRPATEAITAWCAANAPAYRDRSLAHYAICRTCPRRFLPEGSAAEADPTGCGELYDLGHRCGGGRWYYRRLAFDACDTGGWSAAERPYLPAGEGQAE